MNKSQLWKIYIEKNPVFLEGNIRFTQKGLKDFFDQTFEQGVKEGQSKSKSKSSNGSDMTDFLKDILSGKGVKK